MQPRARLVSNLFFDFFKYPSVQQYLQIHQGALVRSRRVQCRLRIQMRQFADSPKQTSMLGEAMKPSDTNQSPSDPTSDKNLSDLPSAEASRRHAVTKRMSHLMDNLQGNIFIASKRINDLTGYSSIEALKKQISILDARAQDAQLAVRRARITYKTTVTDRASTQREVTTLLARKDSWIPSDLERFTALYRMDHSNEQAVQEAATRLADAESEMENLASQLRSSILSRYHEEQIWSDKIRRMSTWGTWVLMGVNVLLFLVFQLGFEPWRRKRLVQGFEEKVREAFEHEKLNRLYDGRADKLLGDTVMFKPQNSKEHIETENFYLNTPPGTLETTAKDEELEKNDFLDTPELLSPTAAEIDGETKMIDRYAAAFKDMLSDRVVEMRKKDILIVALEGAAIGATIVAVSASLFVR